MLEIEILLIAKAVCNLYHGRSDLANFKLDIIKFVLEPIHVGFVKSEAAAFRQVLLSNSGRFQTLSF